MSTIFPNIPTGVLQIFRPEDQREIRRYLLGATAAGAIHNHDNDAQAGQLDENAFLFTPDSIIGDASITAHGFLPKLSGAANEFLDGEGTFDSVTDADLSTADITTNDVSTSKHGFCPKGDNEATHFLRGDATWTIALCSAMTIHIADTQPTLDDNTCALWIDSDAGPAYYFLANFRTPPAAAVYKKVALV